ncbi:MAG: hypothetical protein ABS888_05125 [Eubacteriales bacterium]
MAKWLAVATLLAMLLAMACPALAEVAKDNAISAEDLLGVWQMQDDDRLCMMILPGAYAPTPDKKNLPDLYAYGVWQENSEKRIVYSMLLNKWKPEQNNFLNALLGNTIANAVRTIKAIGESNPDPEDIYTFDYEHANVGVEWLYEDGETQYIEFTKNNSGSLFVFDDDEEPLVLYWLDSYDPHVAGEELHRVTIDAASAEALTQGVLRPVIGMSEDARAQTALAVAQWAADNRCMRMDSEELTKNLHDALAALEAKDAQAFRDNYARISTMLIDALGLNPETWDNPARNQPFKDAGLGEALDKFSADIESRRAADILNAAIGAAMG